MSTHTISVFVENHSGALSRIAGLFSSRGYNISSLTVAETENPAVSRMTIVVSGDESVLEQVNKQLNRLIDVIKVIDFDDDLVIDRELLVVRVDVSKSSRVELINLSQVYDGRVAALTPTSITIELTNTTEKIDEFIALARGYGIKELIRSGKLAMAKK